MSNRSLSLILVLLFFILITFYFLYNLLSNSNILESTKCYIEYTSISALSIRPEGCLSTSTDNQHIKQEGANEIAFELIQDRNMGYKIIVPEGFKGRTYFSRPIGSWHSVVLYNYMVKKYYKNPNADFEQVVKEMFEDIYNDYSEDPEINYSNSSNSEYVRDLQNLFPDNYQVLRVASWGKVPVNAQWDLIDHRLPDTQYFIYNQDYPYMFFSFDTRSLDEEDLSKVADVYLPSGFPWQSTFRIIEGNRPCEYLNRSTGVPTNVDRVIIEPVKHRFTVRDVEYLLSTPGNPEKGYAFDTITFDTVNLSRKDSDTTGIRNIQTSGTIQEVRDYLLPSLHIITDKPYFVLYRSLYPFYTHCKNGEERSDSSSYRAYSEPKLNNFYTTIADKIWFNKDYSKWVIIEKLVLSKHNFDNSELVINTFNYKVDKSTSYPLPQELISNNTTTIKLPIKGDIVNTSSLSARWRFDFIEEDDNSVAINMLLFKEESYIKGGTSPAKEFCNITIPINFEDMPSTIEVSMVDEDSCEIVN